MINRKLVGLGKLYLENISSSYNPVTCHYFFIVPPIIQLFGPNKPIREGNSVNLTCKIKKGFPKPQVSWFKNGTERKEKSTTLLLTEVKDEDEGRYTCQAKNAGGFFSDSKYVTVESKFIYYEYYACCILYHLSFQSLCLD